MTLDNYAKFFVWAENKFIDILEELEDSKFEKKLDGPDRSVKSLVNHWIATYNYYFGNKDMESYNIKIKKLNGQSKKEILQDWRTILNKFTEEMINNTKTSFNFPLGNGRTKEIQEFDMFLLYTDHSSYHRGQLMTFLKLLGIKGMNTDYFTYYFSENN